jgi:His/Glu/Gln/Arg/opine family amino acid ABC transporter permease subunit|tara:strand:+ start:5498 stop:6187 length:690 start_codon:yes stop_codon:yes gene_type:complete
MFDLQGYGWTLWVGLGMTLKVGFTSLLLAILMGLLGAWGKLSHNRIGRGLANSYTTIIRGVPELLLLLIIFYGVPILIQDSFEKLGFDVIVDFNSFIAGSLTLGVIYGAFATEVFRGAFLAVPKGQIEAARACGMSKGLAFRRIILPQVWRFALPGLGNVWMVLIKATALISVIQLEELMRKSFITMGTTKEPFTAFFAAALMYLGITIVSMLIQQRVENWANRGVRRA